MACASIVGQKTQQWHGVVEDRQGQRDTGQGTRTLRIAWGKLGRLRKAWDQRPRIDWANNL